MTAVLFEVTAPLPRRIAGAPPLAFCGIRICSRRRADGACVDNSYFEDYDLPFEWTLDLEDGRYREIRKAIVLRWEGVLCLEGMDLLKRLLGPPEAENTPSLLKETGMMADFWELKGVGCYASNTRNGWAAVINGISAVHDPAIALAMIAEYQGVGTLVSS